MKFKIDPDTQEKLQSMPTEVQGIILKAAAIISFARADDELLYGESKVPSTQLLEFESKVREEMRAAIKSYAPRA